LVCCTLFNRNKKGLCYYCTVVAILDSKALIVELLKKLLNLLYMATTVFLEKSYSIVENSSSVIQVSRSKSSYS